MILDDVLIPDELKDVKFVCPLDKCKGKCCVEGDAGAPLEESEIGEIEDLIDDILHLLDKEGREIVQKNGVYDYDSFGHLVTPLKSNDECVFMLWENNHTICVFEKAEKMELINFVKPISCHFYPIRIVNEGAFEKWVLHKWHICHVAYVEGEKKNIPLVFSIKNAIIRRYGLSYFNRLLIKWGYDPQQI